MTHSIRLRFPTLNQ
ncbi:MAG TPA: hypothetical protein DEO65_05585 [Bacillus bacterium]|uniref:Erythromycin resistance leader peptide n=1 Tax=Bacillus norwichensis TaxID=2762217 RepID=A0ABR8VIW8_9BACI|nr:erythromycin resistance leader peptide [Bacillus norwichensis]MBU5334617.1 erythromycin resistance leader peptide [Anaerocolumna aminovalerica]HBZ09337.1 hypothetical protein [Bacillus sp. (in: firmicutes)]